MSNLNEFTEYQVRVAASTAVGFGPFTIPLSVSTNQALPISPPIVEVTNIEAQSINITLTPPSIDEANGKLTEYQVVYYGEEFSQYSSLDVSPGIIWNNSIEVQLTQLEESVVYHVKARIWNAIGAGPFSSEIIRQTNPAPPSAAPRSITFSSVQPTSLSLDWLPPPEKEQNSNSTSYKVQYYGEGFDSVVRTVTTSSTRIQLTGLQEGEVYIVSVCSYNNLGGGPCEIVQQRTLEEKPSAPPQSVTAVALYDTAISVSWYSVVESGSNGFILGYEVSVNGTHHDGHSYLYSTNRTVLIVTALEEHELYSVQVRALNSIGAGPYSDVVDVMTHQDVPAGAPRELEGTPATTSISLTWSSPLAVDINGVVTAYEVHYVGTFEDVRNRTVSTSNTVYTLEQLHADETYLIQVRAYTTKGPGTYSTWIAVTSLEVAPSTHPRGVSTVAHSSTEIDVVWMPPDKSSQNGVITEYVVQISALTRNYSIKFSVSETTFLYTFTDLHPYQEYNVSVAAATQAGVGPFSTPLVEQSLQDIPRAAPSSLALRNVTARSVTINWVPVSIDDINGILIHYELELSSSHATIKIEPELISYTILGLTPNRDYSVRIAAETPPGTGPYSSLLNFTTGQEAPSVGPVINSIQSITSTTFMIMWSSTTDTVRNGAITGYEIAVTNVLTGIKAYDRTTDANNAMMEVTGLNEYTQYRVSIIAINSAGYSPSTTVSIETAQSKPSGPPQYVYPIFNSTWIELSWFSPTLPDRNGIIIGYDILVNQRVYFSNSTQFVVQHLEEALQYTIQVRAITIIGSGPYSTAINVTTLATSPSAPPQNVNATAISSEEILVTWDPIPFLEQNGHILQYTVYYWFYTVPGVKREIISTNVSMQVTISSLLAYTNYSVVVVASNAVGTSPQSETASIRTLEDIPSAAPGNLTVHILTHSSLTLVWNTIPSRDENGVIIHQTITYQAFTIDTEEQNININSEWTNFTLTNFLPSLTYQISIHASTSIGNGPRSYVNVTMPESTPSAAPVNVMIYNILTGFRVEWDELSLENRNGEITLYQILLTDISNDTTQETFQEYNTTIPEMKLTNLTDFTGYTIAIRAMTSAGYGPFSEALEALTAPDGLECFGYFSRYEREPCSNGAVCKAKGTDDFTCDCVAGYDGVICQNEIDECQTASCQSGNCVDRINNFTCVCFEGYTGRFCEVEIDLCESNPCQNTGSCVPHVNSFECICTSDYVGTVCEFPNRCLETPCKHGHCTPTGENYTCECEIGFSGHDCEYNINNCEGVLCEHGGECLDGVAKFDCACLPGFKGRYCQYTNEELTCESETIWKIIWPATKYSRTAIMPCQYIDPSFVERNATRICYKNGEWGKVNMDDCIRTQFDILSDHLTRYYDIHSPSTQGSINVTELVQNTAFVVYGRVILSPAEIRLTLNLTAFSLNSILNIDDSAKRSYLTSLNEKFICIFSAILSDQNTEYFTHEYQNMATNLLSTLQIFAELNAEAYVKTNDKPCIYIASDNIQLFVREIGSKHNVTDSKVIFNCKQNYQVLEENVLSLPSSLTDVLQDNSKLRMSVAYSKNLGKILTQTSDGIYSDSFPASTLAMIELAIDLPDQLKNTIHIQFSLLDDQTIKYGGLHCVYWNETLHGWSTSGLNVFETTNKSVTCSSNHISTFMILTESITVVDPLQNIINYVIFAIAGISLFCLISAIIFFTLLGRKLIDNDIYIAQYSLCISLILSMLTHVIGMLKYPPIQDYCHVVAVIVYLFSVTSTTCFLAEGATICFKFILPKVKRRIYILSFILGWVCPVPITVFRVVFDLNNLGVRNEYCWLASQSSTIWSMIEPILVIFFITLITVLLSLVMCCFSRNIGLVHIAKLALKTHIIFIPFILTPWIVNIVNIYVSVPYYTWVYIGVISFQGILFLPLYALCNKSIRNKLCFSKKDQEAVNDEDLPSPYSVNTPIFNMEFANPLDTADDVDKLQDGAIPYLEDKLLFGDMKDGHITPAHENEYAELELSGFIEASSVQCDDTIIQEQNKSAIENIYTGVEARAEEKSEPDS